MLLQYVTPTAVEMLGYWHGLLSLLSFSQACANMFTLFIYEYCSPVHKSF